MSIALRFIYTRGFAVHLHEESALSSNMFGNVKSERF
jgi:hypothetical protein